MALVVVAQLVWVANRLSLSLHQLRTRVAHHQSRLLVVGLA
jgi:hypothetical protein